MRLLPTFLGFALTSLAAGAPMLLPRGHGSSPVRPSIDVLVRDACSDSTRLRLAAFDELNRRIEARELAESVLLALIDGALTRQQSHSTEWDHGWGNLLERARNAELLDDARWQRYMRQAVRFSLRVRPNVRVANEVPYEIAYDIRLGERSLIVKLSTRQAFDAPTNLILNHDHRWLSSGEGRFVVSAYPQNQRGTGLRVGPHTLFVVVNVQLFEDVCAKPVCEYWVPLADVCNIVPRDEPKAAPTDVGTARSD